MPPESPSLLAQFQNVGLARLKDFVRSLLPYLKEGDVLALSGDLGSGKTCFARELIHQAGYEGHVPSPTFTLVQTYKTPKIASREIWHFDLYRLEKPEDAFELGIEEAFQNALSLIEWPEKLGPYLPPDALNLHFDYATPGKDLRHLSLEGTEIWHQRLEGEIFEEWVK